ncbi:MAG: ABC-F type ribosomal protection protein [Christensenellaceae bacterium]|jgi:lincosamide and streptogramin A transport system ATP-binding/permease protein|nr:ABC-F type ribosomal protection protein [Christensenellaceae bacterium]
MSMIQVRNLTFAYEGSYDTIFENVSFRFDTDWRLGLTGRNGRGKTTLLRLLMGKYEYQGEIAAPVRFDYFPFEVTDPSRAAQAVVEEIIPNYEPWRLSRELSLLEMEEAALMDRPFATLSMGERTKLLLAALFLREGGFLLIDEPTNHLDMHARAITSRYLRGKQGFLLVSHDRVFLDSCIDHILAINKAGMEVQRGNFSSWQENKRQQDAFEREESERLKRDIGRLNEASRRTAGWSDKIEKSKTGTHPADRGYIGHQSAKMMQRAKSTQRRREAAVEEKSKLLHNVESAEALALHPLAHHAPRLAELSDVRICYGEHIACENIGFTIKTGERVALLGRNGCGKSSVLKLLLGEPISYTGALHMASGLRISYVPQDTALLRGSLKAYARESGVEESLFLAILRKLDFARAQFEKEMQHYSAGQKKKVLLARSLCEQAHLYIWDEPLNYIDVLSRVQIEELVLKHRPTLLFVEHDRAFCDAIATKTVRM